MIIGSLRKITQFICSHYPEVSQNPQIDNVLFNVLALILNPENAKDPQIGHLCIPVIVDICENIIHTLGSLYPEKVEELLRNSQIELLPAAQIEKLCAALKNVNFFLRVVRDIREGL